MKIWLVLRLNFVVIDLETTGLAPQTDEIIEIGAVKIIDNQLASTFQTFVRPRTAVSGFITDLTGITQDMLKDAPVIESAIDLFQDFADSMPGEHCFWVAHNKDFESSFLNRFLDIEPDWLDTIDIAKAAFPLLPRYKLGFLLETLNIEYDTLHRALDDAKATANLLLFLQRKLSGLPNEVWQDFIELTAVMNTPLAQYMNILYRKKDTNIIPEVYGNNDFDSTQLCCIDLDAENRDYKIPQQDITTFFNRLPSDEFEIRPEQIKISQLVSQTFNDKQLLMVEAGTGTGKSLAYLLPAVLYSKGSNQQVIISTNTINLQEQLLNKDIPLLQKELNFNFFSVVIKGRTNYFCLHKWRSSKHSVTKQTLALYLRIAHWLHKTSDGDISELNLRGQDLDNIQYFNAANETCFGYNCKFNRNQCYVSKVRRKAQQANLLIVNHSLLLSASLYGADNNSVLPAVQNLIIDEAHQLAAVAQRQFSAVFSAREIQKRLRNPWQRSKPEELLRVITKLENGADAGNLKEQLEQLITTHKKLGESCKRFDEATQELFDQYSEDQRTLRIHQQRYDSELWQPIETVLGNLFFDLKALEQIVKELLYNVDESNDPFVSGDALMAFQLMRMALEELLAVAQSIIDGKKIQTNEEYVIWLEKTVFYSYRYRDEYVEWWIMPVDIRPMLNKYIYQDKDAIIFTSATLANGSDFSYFQRELGLDQQELPVEKYLLSSPFDYKNNSLLLLANDIDEFNKSSEYSIAQQLAGAIARLVKAAQGRALVLFTSYQQLNAVYDVLKPMLDLAGIQLLAHGISGQRSMILERMQKSTNLCVLGVNSFWEGVDIKGSNLSLLIIVRLPFAPPNTPVLEAQFEMIKEKGGNPFRDYSLPQAIIRFKQGFGRLIRSKSDRGVCCVLDQRIWSQKSYGKKFLTALPDMKTKCCSIEEMVNEIKKFL